MIQTSSEAETKAVAVAASIAENPPVDVIQESQEQVIDLNKILKSGEISTGDKEYKFWIGQKLAELDAAVAYASRVGAEWLEVEEPILKHFYGGTIHPVGYYIYKGVKLCLTGTADALAKRDNLTCNEILFPKEGYMKLGVKRGNAK